MASVADPALRHRSNPVLWKYLAGRRDL